MLISEFHGPLTIGDPGKAPDFVMNWKLAQSSVRGTPVSPERVSLVFDRPVLDRVAAATSSICCKPSASNCTAASSKARLTNHPVIEIVLRLDQASAPIVHPAAEQPVDADITAVLRGLNDFSPKPWPARFRELQAAGGQIDITQARVQQGETIAVGAGSLSLNASGRLEGQLRVTVAGIEPFLNSIGAQQMVQSSPTVDKLSGALDRLVPGLGTAARQAGHQRQYVAGDQFARRADHARRPARGDPAAAFQRWRGVSRAGPDRRDAGVVLGNCHSGRAESANPESRYAECASDSG